MPEKDYDTAKNKGNECFKIKKYNEALKYYNDAINFKKDEPIAYSNRAICYINLGKFLEAKQDCDTAISLDSTMVKAYYRRGLALRGLHRYEKALQDFQQVSKLDETFTKLVDGQIKTIDQLIKEDKRLELSACDKPDSFKSKLPVKSFQLNKQYSGQKDYLH